MLFFKKRYDLLALSKEHKLPKIYDLLNVIKNNPDIPVAATDGSGIFVNIDAFNTYEASSEFFFLCHEMLHIIYHHLDRAYYPEDKYPNDMLLNMCQDVVINEFLDKRLKYKEPNGLYLNNIAEALYNRGLLHSKTMSYSGILTTRGLYDFFNNRYSDDQLNQLMKDLNYDSSDDRLQDNLDDSQSLATQQRMEEAVNNVMKSLKITPEMLDKENADKEISAGSSQDYSGMTSTSNVQVINSSVMVDYINSFIGSNAVIKGRHRTYTRPSRRVQLSNNLLAPGYKHFKNVKKISMYLDVSGSMDSRLVSSLYKTLKTLYNKVDFDFYTFNSYIRKIDIKSTPEIYIGGGTDITRVLNTIDEENQDVAIMITDCDDHFTLKNVKANLMIYTNNQRVRNDNPRVKLTYFE